MVVTKLPQKATTSRNKRVNQQKISKKPTTTTKTAAQKLRAILENTLKQLADLEDADAMDVTSSISELLPAPRQTSRTPEASTYASTLVESSASPSQIIPSSVPSSPILSSPVAPSVVVPASVAPPLTALSQVPQSPPQGPAASVNASAPSPGNSLEIHVDGACPCNGTRFARGGVGVWFGEDDKRNASEPLPGRLQTNQRAELQAIIRALEKTSSDRDITIFSDSLLSICGTGEWYEKWELNGGLTSRNKEPANLDLIDRVRDLLRQREGDGFRTAFEWEKGHSGVRGNERANYLASEAAKKARKRH